MSYNKITVRSNGILRDIRTFAQQIERIPKSLDKEFSRAVARNAMNLLWGGVGQDLADKAPVDSGAYAGGLTGSQRVYTGQTAKAPRRQRKANPVLNFRPSGGDLSVDYGTDPVDVAYDNHYGKHVDFNVNEARPEIKAAIVAAVQEETERFIADLTSRAIRNAGRSRGVRFKKSA
jgi:hypothetical protein